MIDIQKKLEEIGPYIEAPDDSLLVCRCEEVTKGEIRKAVHEGWGFVRDRPVESW